MNELIQSFVERVADKLIEQLKAGTAPWQKPWEAGEPGSWLPFNPTTGSRYNGINAILLMSQGRDDQRWMTYKQAAAAGANVRKGEKGTPIQYWKFHDEQAVMDADGKPVLDGKGEEVKHTVRLERPSLFTATVFNAEQIEGLAPQQPRKPQEWGAVDRAEGILRASGANIHHSEHDRAFYRVATDTIHLPDRAQFPTAGAYYATALHELGHWTGHESRLGRDLGHPFGSEGYAREELRAEIASMILGDELGIGHNPAQHAAYVGSWIKVLQDEPLEIFRAAAAAEKIHGHLLGLELQQTADLALAARQTGELTHESTRSGQVVYCIYEKLDDGYHLLGRDTELIGVMADVTVIQQYQRDVLINEQEHPERIHYRTNNYDDTLGRSVSPDGPMVLAEPGFYERFPLFSATFEREKLELAERRRFEASVSDDVQAVTEFIVRNQGLDTDLVARNAADAAPDLRGLLADAGRIAAIDYLLDDRLYELPRMAVSEVQAVVALSLGRDDAMQRTARMVSDFVDDNEGYAPAVIADHLREASPLLLATLASDEIMAELQGTMLERLAAMPPAFLNEVLESIEQALPSVIEAREGLPAARSLLLAYQDQRATVPTGAPDLSQMPPELRLDAGDMELVAALTDLSRGDVQAAEALALRADLLAERQLGSALPRGWSGSVDVVGPVAGGASDGAAGEGEAAADKTVMEWRVLVQGDNGELLPIATYASQGEADDMAGRLALIHAWSEPDEAERAVKLARIREEQVRQNPDSTAEDIVAAREARKDAELSAVQGDADFQRRVSEQEREIQSRAAAEAAVLGQIEGGQQRLNLQVPFKQKDEVKELGAKWDRNDQIWYVPAGMDPAPFAKWAPAADTAALGASQAQGGANTPTTQRERPAGRAYLSVPYGERAAAKAAGAQWDKTAKSWYAGPKADPKKLQRWHVGKAPVQQAPAMTPREEFAEALMSLGCVLSGDHPVMDGKAHRISVEGEKFSRHSGSGFYVGHLDGHPAGYIKNNKTGNDLTWKSKGYSLDPQQRAVMSADAAAKLKEREAAMKRVHEQAAGRVARQVGKLLPAEQPTSYMLAKGIQPHAGALTDADGRKTYVPAVDVDGRLWTMQVIQEDGSKRFAKDSRKEGCFHVVGGMAALAEAPAIVIGEGYATAASLKESLGFATVLAFDSGNLAPVALALHEKYPDKPIVIAGDDDRHLELILGVNPGRTKAEEAARLVGGKVMLPIFAPGENSYPPALAPVTPDSYREHQRAGDTLGDEQLAAIGRMKLFTDFNDLATRSVLGRDGLDRQAHSLVESMVSKAGLTRVERQMEHTLGQDHVATHDGDGEQARPRRVAKIA